MSNLKELATSLNSGKGINFMEGREKGDTADIIGKNVTIVDFDFISGDNGDYAVFILAEDKKKFYFGGSVITNALKELEHVKADVQAEGLPARLVEKKSKKNRAYTSVEFYPDGNDLPF